MGRVTGLEEKLDGHEMRRIRKGLGMTMDEFATQLGKTKVTVFNWEHGKNQPDRGSREELARYLEKIGLKNELLFRGRYSENGNF